MDKTKLRNVVSRFEEYLIVDHGLGKTTVEGYGRSLSIALRRMRKFVPSHQDIKRHVYWGVMGSGTLRNMLKILVARTTNLALELSLS